MPEDLLILLARTLGIAGVMLLSASTVLGVLLASRTAQRLRLLRGRTFHIHRPLSVFGGGAAPGSSRSGRARAGDDRAKPRGGLRAVRGRETGVHHRHLVLQRRLRAVVLAAPAPSARAGRAVAVLVGRKDPATIGRKKTCSWTRTQQLCGREQTCNRRFAPCFTG
jgi:hypothetical protein